MGRKTPADAASSPTGAYARCSLAHVLGFLCASLCVVAAYPSMSVFPTSSDSAPQDRHATRCGHLHVTSVWDLVRVNNNTRHVALSCPSVITAFSANASSGGADHRPVSMYGARYATLPVSGAGRVAHSACVRTPHCRYNHHAPFWTRQLSLKVCAVKEGDMAVAELLAKRQGWLQQWEREWAFRPRGVRCLHSDHLHASDKCKPENVNEQGGRLTLRLVTVQKSLQVGKYVLEQWYESRCLGGAVNVRTRCHYDPFTFQYHTEWELGTPCPLVANGTGQLVPGPAHEPHATASHASASTPTVYEAAIGGYIRRTQHLASPVSRGYGEVYFTGAHGRRLQALPLRGTEYTVYGGGGAEGASATTDEGGDDDDYYDEVGDDEDDYDVGASGESSAADLLAIKALEEKHAASPDLSEDSYDDGGDASAHPTFARIMYGAGAPKTAMPGDGLYAMRTRSRSRSPMGPRHE